MYWMPTLTFWRRPASLTEPGVEAMSSSAAALGCTSSRSTSSWLSRSNSGRAMETRSGWATHVPSKPWPASRCLSSRTFASATSFTAGSCPAGVKAPPPLRQRAPVHGGISPRRDERRHPADRVRAATMAGLHEQVGVCAHEGHRHRHLAAVRQEELLPVPELLD